MGMPLSFGGVWSFCCDPIFASNIVVSRLLFVWFVRDLLSQANFFILFWMRVTNLYRAKLVDGRYYSGIIR